ncbi:chromosome segregation ATPase [Arthrobacter sp. CAN_A6]|uniref:DNA-binding protein n=1 Tax=Arthrobacter sp. CAN_A6 TaxID=2787721 RepID=UPI0018CB204E
MSESVNVEVQGPQGRLSARDRVYAAAERIGADRRPTVSTVRAEAGVSNADATRYLKEWNEEKLSAHRTIAAAPPALLEMASRLAGECWAEASRIAAERHAAVEATWKQESKDKDTEMIELVADLDQAATDKDALVADFTAQVAALEEQLRSQDEELQRARTDVQETRQEAVNAGRDLASAQTHITTLQGAYDALLERITPPTPATTTTPTQKPSVPSAEVTGGKSKPAT